MVNLVESVLQEIDAHISSARQLWSPFQQILAKRFECGDDFSVAYGLARSIGTHLKITVDTHNDDRIWVVYFSRLTLDGFSLSLPAILRGHPAYGLLMHGIICLMPLFCALCETTDVRGSVLLNNWDCGMLPGLTFCSAVSNHTLIPDRDFLGSRGYDDIRKQFAASEMPWTDRKPLALWRGTATGPHDNGKWDTLPRVKLCRLGQLWPELVDAGLTEAPHDMPAEVFDAYRASNLVASFMPQKDMRRFRYLIDIDGYTNAWSGLFTKLLSGSTVLKVESPGKFRQWYYDRLKPWEHYVPIRSDLADLPTTILYLRERDDLARKIADAGRRLADEMTYDRELQVGVQAIAGALVLDTSEKVT